MLEAFKAEILKHPEWHGNYNRIGKVQSGLRIDVFQAEQRQKTVAEEQLEEKEPKGVTTVTKPLGVVLNNVHVDDEYGYVDFDLDQESELVYPGEKNREWERFTFTWSPTANDWHYQFYDLRGSMTAKVFLPGEDEAAVTEALLARFRDMLTRLNMWRDDFEQEYRDMVAEGLEYQAEQKQERSDRAKHAAVTRKRRKALGATRAQKISAAIRDANTDGNSSRAITAMAADADIPDHIAPEIRENIKDLRAGKSHFSALPNTRDGD